MRYRIIIMGDIFYYMSELGNALEFHNKSLRILEKLADQHGIATTCNNLGDVMLEIGELYDAEDWYGRSISLSKKIDVKDTLTASLLGLTDTLNAVGRYDEALKLCNEAAKMAKDAGMTLFHARSERLHGKILSASKDWQGSEIHFSVAENEFMRLNADVEVAKVWFDRGCMLFAKGDLSKGRDILENAKKVFTSHGIRLWEKKCNATLVRATKERCE